MVSNRFSIELLEWYGYIPCMNKATLMRPQSLSEVARQTVGLENFDELVAEFLDEFYALPSLERLAEEPLKLVGHFEMADVADVYLAAVAESLAERINTPCPEWAEGRSLRYPWFTNTSEYLRAVLLVESPLAFRKRNLFVSENAMSRA